MMGHRMPNHCVQATPDCATLFIVGQVAGAPDAQRCVTTGSTRV